MQMRQIWTRRWIAGNNTLHSSNRGGSRSQHSLLFCCFHKKAASVVGKFPLGWVQCVRSWGINSLLSHDTRLPWDYTQLVRDGENRFTGGGRKSHVPISLGLEFDGLGAFLRMNLRLFTACDRFFWVLFSFPQGHLTWQSWESLLGTISFLLWEWCIKQVHRWQFWTC